MWRKKGHESVARLLPRECWKSYCELEQPILLNKGFDERRGSVLIWIRNLCLCAPFLSRLPSTTPLWFKALFGFSSASQVITFQHVAPFTGGINHCCYFFIPHMRGPRGTREKKVSIFKIVLRAWRCCVNVSSDCPFCWLIANYWWTEGVQGLQVGWLSIIWCDSSKTLLEFSFVVLFYCQIYLMHHFSPWDFTEKNKEIFSKLPKFKVIS